VEEVEGVGENGGGGARERAGDKTRGDGAPLGLAHRARERVVVRGEDGEGGGGVGEDARDGRARAAPERERALLADDARGDAYRARVGEALRGGGVHLKQELDAVDGGGGDARKGARRSASHQTLERHRLGRRGRRRAAGGRAGIAPGVPGSTGNHPLDREETTPRRALALERRGGETIGTFWETTKAPAAARADGTRQPVCPPASAPLSVARGWWRSEPRQVQPPRGARSRRTPSRGRRRTRGTRARALGREARLAARGDLLPHVARETTRDRRCVPTAPATGPAREDAIGSFEHSEPAEPPPRPSARAA